MIFAPKAHGYFANYISRYTDVQGSPFTKIGPDNRDFTAELSQAIRARGLRFGFFFNVIRPDVCPYWLEMKYELIDRFQPSSIWLDGDKLSFPADDLKSRELLAYYYNHAAKPDEVACEDALGAYKQATWGKRLVHGDWYRREAAHSAAAEEISDGHYVRYEEVFRGGNRAPHGRSRGRTKNLIDWLIHVTSHGGNLELAIFPDLEYPGQKRALLQLGPWLSANGEAIFGTRPWVDGRPHSKTTAGIDVELPPSEIRSTPSCSTGHSVKPCYLVYKQLQTRRFIYWEWTSPYRGNSLLAAYRFACPRAGRMASKNTVLKFPAITHTRSRSPHSRDG